MNRILKSIPAKVCICIFLVEGILLVLIGYFYLNTRFTEIDQTITKKLAIPGTLMSQGVLQYEKVRDFDTLSNILQEETLDTFFINNDGRVLYSADPSKEGIIYLAFLDRKETELLPGNLSSGQQTSYVTNSGKQFLINISPVWSDNRFAGSLYIKINTETIQANKSSILFSFLCGAIFLNMLTSLLGGYGVHLLVVTRMKEASEILCEVINGEYSKRIVKNGHSDQLGNLMEQINSMIETTEHNTQYLHETIEKLHREMDKGRDTQLQLMHAEKLSALGRLSASIVHEFGNPLLGVRFMLEDINRRVSLTPEDQQLLFLGLEECDRMKTLLRSLRNLNKPSSAIKTSFNIEQTIDNILTFQEKYFKSTKIKLSKKYNLFFPEIIAIEDQITQVLINIIINAASAIPKKGGTITINTDIVNSNTISIEISDTGVGISKEKQKRIFEPFYSTKTDGEGTGLGLTISYGIIQNHGGSLSCKSQENMGTAFLITLPTGYEYARLPLFVSHPA